MEKQIIVRRNEKFGGLEIEFPAKPPQDVLDLLKSKGFRWNRKDKCWYTKHDAALEQEMTERFV